MFCFPIHSKILITITLTEKNILNKHYCRIINIIYQFEHLSKSRHTIKIEKINVTIVRRPTTYQFGQHFNTIHCHTAIQSSHRVDPHKIFIFNRI